MDQAVGIDAWEAPAVIVTRGDVELTEILDSHGAAGLPFTYIWNNAIEVVDVGVLGRYKAAERFSTRAMVVQDDDCLLEPDAIRALLDNYEPGVITANMPERFRTHYPDSCLVGFGAIFDRDLPEQAFARFRDGLVDYTTAQFRRECDTVFTTLTPRRLLDLPYRDLPHAHAPDRLFKQPDHFQQRQTMLQLARQVRDAAVA